MKRAKKIFEVLGLVVALIVVLGILIIISNIRTKVGYIGDQEVVATKLFNHLTVFDKEWNDRHYSNVRSFSFSEDSLTIVEKTRKKKEIKLERTEITFGSNYRATLDFSKLTIATNNGNTYYYGVKSIGTDYSRQLWIQYYDGRQEWIE